MGNYKVVKQAISFELANFLYNYFLLKREAVDYMYSNNWTYDNGMLGTWKDEQIPNTYSIYGDPAFDTLLMKVLPVMKHETGLDVIPTYSYARIYKKGDILKRHKDRRSCEISTTLHLGGDPWPIFMDPRPGVQCNMPIRKSGDPGQHLWRDADLEPISGRIIMFPAWLWHAVGENKSNDVRISVSFNFIQEGFNG